MESTPRPRDFLRRTETFGDFEEVVWRDTSTATEQDWLLAAQWQHFVAAGIRDALQYRGMTVEGLAAEFGLERQQMGRFLRGDAWMRLIHFAKAQRLLGVRLIEPSTETPRRAGRQVEPG